MLKLMCSVMRKLTIGAVGLSILLSVNVAHADGEEAKKVKSAFSLDAPSGWVEDNSVALDNRLNAVYYPENSSWNESSTVIYSNIEDLNEEKTMKDIITWDIANYKIGAGDLKVTTQPTINIKKGMKATVKYITGTSYESFEAVAYVQIEDHVVIVVLSSKSQEDFDKSISAFEDLVASLNYNEGIAQN